MPEARLPRLLLVDDDATFRKLVSESVAEEGFDVDTAVDGMSALDRMSRRAYDLALVDLRMPEMDGLSLLAEMQRRHPSVVPIVLTGYGTVETAVTAMRRGAFHVLAKRDGVDEIVRVLRDALAQRMHRREGTILADALEARESFFGMTAASPSMFEVFRAIERLWTVDRPVLVCGESGTGKELVARALHAGSPRSAGPFIAVNCASLKDNFVESELFGHVRGAFTGAVASRDGLFRLANHGVLLIDEIGEMPESSQAALLRVIETSSFRPLGATQEMRVDVRIVAATNRDLERAVADGLFRKDLFYRLCVGRIDLPPLRERKRCIPLLVNHFVDSTRVAGRPPIGVTASAMEAILAHDWPGNIRELINSLERAALVAPDGLIEARHLTLHMAPRQPPPERLQEGAEGDLTLAQLERAYVEQLLKREGGNLSGVSKILAVDPTTLRRKIRRWQTE